MKTELGRKLYDNLSNGQVDLFMPKDWREDYSLYAMGGPVKDGYKELADEFTKKLIGSNEDVNKYFSNLLQIVHETINHKYADALANTETPVDEVIDKFSEFKQKEAKPMISKEDKMKQLIKDSNNKAKDQFDYKVRDLFKGAQTEGPIKDWVKDMEILHRAAVIDKLITESGSDMTKPKEIGVPEDLINLDSEKFSESLRNKMLSEIDTMKQYKAAFKALLDYRIEKSQPNC